MELQDTLFIWFNISIIVIFIMGLFIWKYYPLFQFRDKLIIAYLGLLASIVAFIYLCFDYPSSNSFFLVIIPFSISMGIFKLYRLYETKGREFSNPLKDKIFMKWTQLFTMIAVVLYFCFSNFGTGHSIAIILFLAFVVNHIYSLVKLYKTKNKGNQISQLSNE